MPDDSIGKPNGTMAAGVRRLWPGLSHAARSQKRDKNDTVQAPFGFHTQFDLDGSYHIEARLERHPGIPCHALQAQTWVECLSSFGWELIQATLAQLSAQATNWQQILAPARLTLCLLQALATCGSGNTKLTASTHMYTK